MGVQVKNKYTSTMMDIFRETFCYLPLAYVLKQKAILVGSARRVEKVDLGSGSPRRAFQQRRGEALGAGSHR